LTADGFETGRIRPPSEAMSLLVRVSRNCPWNRCAFCPVYKGEKYSRRDAAEIHADLDALKDLHGDAPRTVFLQDADPLNTHPDVLVDVLTGIRERFPNVRRITAYARSRSLCRRSAEDLRRLREAGLDRVHVGMESGSDRVLELVDKGATREDHREGGLKAKAAGFELSFYLMPGLGGRALTDEHADDSASLVAEVEPHFVRLRTTATAPGTPLEEMQRSGAWTPLDEGETVAEIRRFLAGLEGVTTRLESDHSLNLLMDLRGDLPDDLEDLLAMCDEFLDLPPRERTMFVLGRRTGRIGRVEHLAHPGVRAGLEEILRRIEEAGADPEEVAADLRRRLV